MIYIKRILWVLLFIFKCDKIIRDTNSPCNKEKLLTCHQWYDGYRTALLALGDERIKELL